MKSRARIATGSPLPTSFHAQYHRRAWRMLLAASLVLCALPVLAQQTNLAVTVRHAPNLNGSGLIEGSLQQLLGESVTINGGFTMTGDLLVPGTPTLLKNGNPTFAGTIVGSGSTSPSGYQVTLNGNCSLHYLRTRTTPVSLPTVSAPPQPSGTRSVNINSAGQSIGNPATLRHLTLNGNVGQYVIPPGTYGNFIANGGSGFILGIAGATNPAIYNLQNLTLNGQSRLDVVGPVILTVANGFTANGFLGSTNNPSRLQLQLASGGFTLNGGCTVYGSLTAPAGTVIINGNSVLVGSAKCDRLIVNSGGIIRAGTTVNQTPVANAQSLTVAEDGALNVTLTGSDAEGAALTYAVLSQPGHGTLTGTAPNLVYTPTANFNGTDSFTFKVNDGQADSATATISITVTPVNDAPTAQAQTVSTPEDSSLNITLSGSDVENSPLTFQVITAPAHGTLSGTAPNLTYTPAANYNGPDSFTYKANDGQALSAAATVSITVNPVDDAPVASAQTVTTDEDVAAYITLTAVDVEGDGLDFTVLTQPAHGTLSGTPPNLIYHPATNYNGGDSFTFSASDAWLESAPATVTLVIHPVNDLPVATEQTLITLEDTATNLVLTATDVDGDTLSFTLVANPADGTLNGTTPELVFSPAANFHGTNTFTFVAVDGNSTSAPVAITLVVTPVNDLPVAEAKSITLNEDVAANVVLTGTDVDGDSLTFTVQTQPTNGVLSGTPPNLVYTPNTNYVGADYFTYTANDGTSNSTPAVVTLAIQPVNDAPLADDQSVTTDEDTNATITLTGSDVENDALTFVVATPPAHGALTPGSEPATFNYQPATNYHGPDSFTYTANDGQTNSSAATVSIAVNPVNDAPTATPATVNTLEDTSATVTLTGTDGDGDPLTFTVTISPTHGSLTGIAPNLIYTPAPNYFGNDSFTFTVNDGATNSTPTVISIGIAPVNDAPIASLQSVSTAENTPVAIEVTGGDGDGDALTFAIVTPPAHGTLTLNSPAAPFNAYTYTPDAGYAGPDGFTFKANDGSVDSAPATVSLSVVATNLGSTLAFQTDEDTATNLFLTPVVFDPAFSTITILSLPQHGVLTELGAGVFRYTPARDYYGTDSFQYQATDGLDTVGPITVFLTVIPVNDPPGVFAGRNHVLVETNSAALKGFASDVDLQSGETLTYAWSVVEQVAGATVSFTDAQDPRTTVTFSSAGAYRLRLTVADSGTNASADVYFWVVPSIPPDPALVAPPLDRTEPTCLTKATEFLYTGTNAIQVGVATNTIVFERAAVVKGHVLDQQGQPLPGVGISVLNRPEFGGTATRADGQFDLVVNGGAPITLNYEKPGYLRSQRQTEVPWQRYVTLPDVVMTAYDATVNTVLAGNGFSQSAAGSSVSDLDGSRQAAVYFPPNVTAQMEFPGDISAALSSMAVRATEYTVGSNGPAAMPADLPPSSAYTYCVELSTDEAEFAEADTVRFSEPVSFYVDNFIGFAAGTRVPVGYYDRACGCWVPTPNGRVLNVLSVSGGLAALDVDGSGNAASQAQLDELGISTDELASLAGRYTTGQSFSRARVAHLTPYDLNMIFGQFGPNTPVPPQLPTPPPDQPTDDPCKGKGSIIDVQNQVLGEALSVSGTPFSLNYSSDRVPGRTSARRLEIPIRDTNTPANVNQIIVKVSVAGKEWEQTYDIMNTVAGQSVTFNWDGLDNYGRPVQGEQMASVRIGYAYRTYYVDPVLAGDNYPLFMRLGLTTLPFPSVITRDEAPPTIRWQSYESPLRAWDSRDLGMLGGWSLSAHHTYIPETRTLVMADGSRRSGLSVNAAVKKVTTESARFVAAAPDGSVVFSDYEGFGIGGNSVVRRRQTDGSVVLLGGGGNIEPAEGMLATQARLAIAGLAVGPDGSVFLANVRDARLWQIRPDGRLKPIAGNGTHGYSGDGGTALNAQLSFNLFEVTEFKAPSDNDVIPRLAMDQARQNELAFYDPEDMVVGPDCTLYFIDYFNWAVRRVGNDGTITTICGGYATNTADNIPASEAALEFPSGIAIAPEGDLFVGDLHGLHRISPDGIISQTGITDLVMGLAYAPNRSVYALVFEEIGLGFGHRHIDELKPDGQVIRMAGANQDGDFDDGSAFDGYGALSFPINTLSFTVDANNQLYFGQGAIYRIAKPLPNLSETDYAIPSGDGGQLYVFTGTGKHLRTLDTVTGQMLFEFGYDSAGRLVTVTDLDGDVTTIERDGNGVATAIVSADGHRTALGYDANGWLNRVANPANEAFTIGYTPDGLLTNFTNPRLHSSTMTYDAGGRLLTDTDAAGGGKSLAKVELPDGSLTTVSNAMNYNPTTYRVGRLEDDTEYHENVAPDGTTNRTWTARDGTTTSQSADSTLSVSKDGPDPRWGLMAPIGATASVTLPSGLTMSTASSRSVQLADANNPLSLIAQTDVVTVNGLSATNSYTFDGVNRLVTSASPLGRASTSVLDLKGRVLQTAVPGIAPVNYQYDARGRLLTVAQTAAGQTRTVTHTYDTTQNGGASSGRLLATTDALNRTTAFTYSPDLSGRVTRQTFPNGRFIEFQYDANGNLTGVTPPQKPVHLFGFDARDLVSQYDPPPALGTANNFTTYGYNLNKQLTNVTRPDGLQIGYTYDPQIGWLTNVSLPLGERIGYTYADQSCGCSGAGRVKDVTFSAVDYTSALHYDYDGSLVTGVSWSGPVAGIVNAGYDNFFRVYALAVNGADVIGFGYDDDGLLTQAGALTLSRDLQNGRLTGTTLGSVNDSWTYTGFGEAQTYTATAGATALYAMDFARDNAGRITNKLEVIGGVLSSYDYTYDPDRGWLTDVASNGVAVAHYAYDDNGNRLTHMTPTDTVTGTYDDQDRLLSLSTITPQLSTDFTYTANGELQTKTTGSATVTYSYDVRGSLRDVTLANGVVVSYVIDAAGRRIGRKVNGVFTQKWLYQDSLKPIAELNAAGSVVSRFIYAGKANVPEYMVRGGITYRLITDHLGSVRLVVNASTGSVAQRMDYDEFGRVLADTNPGFQPFGYAGGLYDPLTSLVRFGARDYDAESGRWTSKDPIGFRGGDNWYGYADCDPINLVDTAGLAASGQRYEKTLSGAGKVSLNGTSYVVTTKLDFIVALKTEAAKGELISTFTYSGHGDPDTGALLWAAAKDPDSPNGMISPQDLAKYLKHFKDLFDPCVSVKLKSCGSANPQSPFNAVDAFKTVFPNSTVSGYSGLTLPVWGGVPNNSYFSNGHNFPNTPKDSYWITR